MSHEPNHIDQLLRERLDGFEMAPPADVWTKTEAVLSASRQRRKFFGWFFLGSTILGLFIGGLWYFNGKSPDTSTLAQNSTAENGLTSTAKKSTQGPSTSEVNSKKSHGNNSSNEMMPNLKETGAIDRESKTSRSSRENKRVSGNDIKTRLGLIPERSKTASEQTNLRSTGNGNGEMVPIDLFEANQAGAEGMESIIAVSGANTRITDEMMHPMPFFDIERFNQRSYSAITQIFEEEVLPKRTPFLKHLSVEGSIGYSQFTIQANKNSTDPLLAELLKNAASDQRSFDARLGLNYHVTPSVSFQTGLDYSSARENYTFESSETTTTIYNDTISSYFDTTLNQTVYVIVPISFDTTITVQTATQNYYKMLTLPFQFAWKMPVSKRGELEFALGGALSIYGRNIGNTIVDTSNYAIPSANAFHPKGILSVGGSLKYLHRFGMHHSVYIEPWVRFGITNQSMPTLQYETRRNNYGIRVGYRFYF